MSNQKKNRPSAMVGHSRRAAYFQNLIEKEQLTHCYLFFGSKHIGKATFAHALARALESGTDIASAVEEAFGAKQAEAGYIGSGDTMAVTDDAPGIAVSRAIKSFLSLRPMSPVVSLSNPPRRTVIIHHAESLTPDASHALLRISEDAPKESLIIFIAEHAENILPTLRSRCSGVYFRTPRSADVREYLKWQYDLSSREAEAITELSGGRPGRARQYAENPDLRKRMASLVDAAKKAPLDALYALSGEIEHESEADDLIEALAHAAREFPQKKMIPALSELMRRQTAIHSLEVNRRLQLEAAINAVVLARK